MTKENNIYKKQLENYIQGCKNSIAGKKLEIELLQEKIKDAKVKIKNIK